MRLILNASDTTDEQYSICTQDHAEVVSSVPKSRRVHARMEEFTFFFGLTSCCNLRRRVKRAQGHLRRPRVKAPSLPGGLTALKTKVLV